MSLFSRLKQNLSLAGHLAKTFMTFVSKRRTFTCWGSCALNCLLLVFAYDFITSIRRSNSHLHSVFKTMHRTVELAASNDSDLPTVSCKVLSFSSRCLCRIFGLQPTYKSLPDCFFFILRCRYFFKLAIHTYALQVL